MCRQECSDSRAYANAKDEEKRVPSYDLFEGGANHVIPVSLLHHDSVIPYHVDRIFSAKLLNVKLV